MRLPACLRFLPVTSQARSRYMARLPNTSCVPCSSIEACLRSSKIVRCLSKNSPVGSLRPKKNTNSNCAKCGATTPEEADRRLRGVELFVDGGNDIA